MNINTKLKKLLAQSDNELEKYVINYFLDYGDDEDIECHIKDVINYSCSGGSVSPLIYYADTKKFYIEYESEINEIVEDLERQGIEPLKDFKSPLSNYLAWLGFEEMTRKVANDLEIEY